MTVHLEWAFISFLACGLPMRLLHRLCEKAYNGAGSRSRTHIMKASSSNSKSSDGGGGGGEDGGEEERPWRGGGPIVPNGGNGSSSSTPRSPRGVSSKLRAGGTQAAIVSPAIELTERTSSRPSSAPFALPPLIPPAPRAPTTNSGSREASGRSNKSWEDSIKGFFSDKGGEGEEEEEEEQVVARVVQAEEEEEEGEAEGGAPKKRVVELVA